MRRGEGYAKAGFHSWHVRPVVPGIGRGSDHGADPTYGLGRRYRLTEMLALRDKYSRFELDNFDVDLQQVKVRLDF